MELKNKVYAFAFLALSITMINGNDSNGFGVVINNPNCSNSATQRANLVSQIQQRFYAFQDATSALKRVGQSGDNTLINAALDVFMSFIDPNFTRYEFDTVGIIFGFNTLAEIRAGYLGFATVSFDGFSEHWADNVRASAVVGSNCLQASMTAGGGEWATLDPSNPREQITISNWNIIWTFLPDGPTGPDWYITDYLETGNRIYSFCPPMGEIAVLWSRTFPGATPEPMIPDFSCTGPTGPIAG